MLNQPKNRFRAQKLVRLAALALAGVCLLCIITATGVNSYRWREYNRYSNERQTQLANIVNYLEFNGLDEYAMEMMATHSQRYTDYSNFVITDSTCRVLYSLNQGYLDDSGYLYTCTEGNGELYTVNARNEAIARYVYDTNNITPLANLSASRYGNMRDTSISDLRLYNEGWEWRRVYYAGFPTKDMHLFFFFDDNSPKWNLSASRLSSLNSLSDTAAIIGVFSFLFYWAALPVWVFLDARRRNDRPALWGVLSLFTNIVGLIVYLCVRQESAQCAGCKEPLAHSYVVCPVCGLKNRSQCEDCRFVLEDHWAFCPKCGKPVETHEVGETAPTV